MNTTTKYRLGLDLGSNSLGWIALGLRENDKSKTDEPFGILASGVRMFEAGVEGAIEQGKDSSRGAKRREARQPRRQHWRRQQRLRKLFGTLQSLGLLPQTPERNSEFRHEALHQLDSELRSKWCEAGNNDDQQKLTYILRATALKQKLEPFELGRALYQLAQRRGYLSNRKTDKSDNEEIGKVQTGIDLLEKAIHGETTGEEKQRTFAQFVCDDFRQEQGVFELKGIDQSSPTRRRLRRHYTSRKMYVNEFHTIREAQTKFGFPLSEKDWKRIEKSIFFQRPMKSQRNLVGRCSLAKDKYGRGKRRCSMALLEFQEFRLLQGLNHLRIILPDGEIYEWSEEDREKVIDHLRKHGDLLITPPQRRSKSKELPSTLLSLLDLPKGTEVSASAFRESLGEDGKRDDENDTKLIGDRTSSKMYAIFGDRWFGLAPETQKEIIYSVLYLTSAKSLKTLAVRKWDLSEVQATALCNVSIEDGYAALSKEAILALLPEMRKGASFATARKLIYPESFEASDPVDLLPPVNQWNADIRNPAVIRALSELRKVVNHVIRRFGKPESIHIELARDLKRSRKERKDTFQKNEANRKSREAAVAKIAKELGITNPSRSLIEKWQLAEECKWVCPYTGQCICASTLDQFDIEHIYPRKYLDDSFTNKTLCEANFNRQIKKDRLPSQCVDEETLEAILARVKRFSGNLAEVKLKRFKATSVSDDFVARQLNDTRYNSRLASDYLGTLYGGRNDQEGKQRIVTPTGSLTWMFRTGWGLNRILSETDLKDRRYNRHHAVDALCVALTTQKSVNAVSSLAGRDNGRGDAFSRFVAGLADQIPWPTSHEDATNSIRSIVISHRPSRTIAGPMHAESIYSKPHFRTDPKNGKIVQEYRIRKPLDKLTAKEILGDQIVDPNVRAAVQKKFEELVQTASSKKDQDPANMWADLSQIDKFPRLAPSPKKRATNPNATGSPIFSVRLKTDVKPKSIGKGVKARQIASGKDSNYAILLYEVVDKNGTAIRWVGEVITRLEAHLRLSSYKSDSDTKDINNFDNKITEKIRVPQTSDQVLKSATPLTKLKAGETIRYICSLTKNDMVELDTADNRRMTYRIQKFSDGEIQLCEHFRDTVRNEDRSQDNRITSFIKLKDRNVKIINILPDSRVERC